VGGPQRCAEGGDAHDAGELSRGGGIGRYACDSVSRTISEV
jgi:hypothetical protein